MDAYRKPDPERLREQEEQAAEETRRRELEQEAAEEKRRRGREKEAAEEERLRAVEEERQRRELAWELRRRIREEEAEAEWRLRERVRRAEWKSTWAMPLLFAYLTLGGVAVARAVEWLGMGSLSSTIILILFGLVGLCVWANLRDPPESRD